MDGLRFILIICLFAQVTQAQNAGSGTERDFGWQVADADGALEYIVQLAPDKIALMQSTHQENISDMPPELVGRVTRFVVRIGTEPLPRTPSLDNIASYFPKLNSVADLSNALDPNRISDIEPGAILNVQNGGATPSPNLPGPLPNLPKYNLDQNLAAAEDPLANLPNPNLARDFLSAAGNNATQPTNTPANPLPSTKFQDTAPQPNAAANPNLFGDNDPTGTKRWQDPNLATPQVADNRGSYGQGNLPTDPKSLNPNSLSNSTQNPGYANRDPRSGPGFGNLPNGRMPGQNLGDAVAQNPYGYDYQTPNQQNYGNPNNIAYATPNAYDNPYRNNIPPGSGFANPATSGPTLQDRGERLASLPGSSSQSTAGSSPSDNSGGTPNAETQTQPRSKAGENFLQVFFLLSLVVNFYLGVLIRKLLMRYRSLLASVRSQTA